MQVRFEVALHLIDGLVPGRAPLHAEVLVEQRAVQPLDEAVALRPTDACGAVSNAFELQEQFVGMLIRATAELAAVVGQDGVDRRRVFLERTAARPR